MQGAIALLLVIGLVNLLKGLDYEESIFGWVVALLLYVGRSEFPSTQAPISLRSAIWRVPLHRCAWSCAASFTDWMTSGRPKLDSVMDESGALMSFKRRTGALRESRPQGIGTSISFQWMPLAIHLVEIATLLGMRTCSSVPWRRRERGQTERSGDARLRSYASTARTH